MNYEQRIYQAVTEEGVPSKVAEIMVSQTKLESANYTSHLFNISRNLVGMKMPSKRKTPYIDGPSPIVMTAEGSTPYAHYDTVEDSAKDLVEWFKYFDVNWDDIGDADKYSAFLKSKGYYGAEQTAYTNLLKKYLVDAKQSIGSAIQQHQGITIATGVTVLATFAYFLIKFAKSRKK